MLEYDFITLEDYWKGIIKTGDIAIWQSHHLFGLGIRLVTGPFTHVGYLSREENNKVYVYHAAKGMYWHKSFIKQDFEEIIKNDNTLKTICRLDYSAIWEQEYIVMNILKSYERVKFMENASMGYDWGMILAELHRFNCAAIDIDVTMRKPILDNLYNVMCSEGVSMVFDPKAYQGNTMPSRKNYFLTNPESLPMWPTPSDIAFGPYTNFVLVRKDFKDRLNKYIEHYSSENFIARY